MRVALYTGSFDPVTNGHLDIIAQAAPLFDRLVIGIGVHPGKNPVFTPKERGELVRQACQALVPKTICQIDVTEFSGLAIIAAREAGASVLVRGLRDGVDLAYEMQMAGMNRAMAPQIATVFFSASPGHGHITATLVRQIAAMKGDVSSFVPPIVSKALAGKFITSRA